jgi:peptidoglycan/LPS O-acetylase OafA/YrhL
MPGHWEWKEVEAVPEKGRDNAFNLLRLVAAAWVFLSHEHLMAGTDWAPNGELGVYVFFSISGFLIARSWERRSSAFDYLRNRCLRILPGLWTVVLLCALVIGPLASSLPPGRYFSDPGTWRYLLNGVFDLQLQLPGVFYGQNYQPVNTPLWTLMHETLFYILLVPLGLLLRQHLRLFLLLAWLLLLAQQAVSDGPEITHDLVGYFLGGALIWQFRQSLPFGRGMMLLAALGVAAHPAVPFGGALCTLCLPYFIVWLGLRRPPALFNHFRKNDYSYGFYVWGMPSQQCVVRFARVTAFGPHLALAFAAAALCAVASWFLIERRALRLKAAEATAPDRPGDLETLALGGTQQPAMP